MSRTVMARFVAFFFVALSLPATAAADGDLKILTFPIGLVTGEHLIEFDFGPSGKPAELYLDGAIVCSPDPANPRCLVDLGEAPRVHLLELIRRNGAGDVVARAKRWINRPGQEAELAMRLVDRSPQGICGGRVIWLHPLKRHPVLLEVTHNGRRLRIAEDGRSFAFPCPDPGEPNMLVTSAVFPDGSRAAAVTMTGGFGGREEVTVTALPLVGRDPGPTSCVTVTAGLGPSATAVEDTGFEVVFVLDPFASYRGLVDSAGSHAPRGNAWRRSGASLFDAEKIWFVTPDAELRRMNAFGSNAYRSFQKSSGRANWLHNLFDVGMRPLRDGIRLADAVAASGLVAAAGPRRRAIVLILGNRAERDDSLFSAEQAQAYLAEIAVPLLVIRTGKVRDDGWPTGVKVHNMQSMATTLGALKERLDRQCIVWFHGEQSLRRIGDALPQGVEIAGRNRELDKAIEAK
ncbi:MAG: hypothetical protein ACC742_08250 [Thermoanaerobaculales bacterium]